MVKVIKIIRYLLLKIMKKLRQPDDDRPAIAATDHLLDKLLPSAFSMFKNSEFRKIVNFDKIGQVEQDGILMNWKWRLLARAFFI